MEAEKLILKCVQKNKGPKWARHSRSIEWRDLMYHTTRIIIKHNITLKRDYCYSRCPSLWFPDWKIGESFFSFVSQIQSPPHPTDPFFLISSRVIHSSPFLFLQLCKWECSSLLIILVTGYFSCSSFPHPVIVFSHYLINIHKAPYFHVSLFTVY